MILFGRRLLLSYFLIGSFAYSSFGSCHSYLATVIQNSSRWRKAKNTAYADIYRSIANCKFLPCEFSGSAEGIVVTGTLRTLDEEPSVLQVEVLNLHTTKGVKIKDSPENSKKLNSQLNNILSAVFDGIKSQVAENPEFTEVELLAKTTTSSEMQNFLRQLNFQETPSSILMSLWCKGTSILCAAVTASGLVDSVMHGTLNPELLATPLIFTYKLEDHLQKDFYLRLDANAFRENQNLTAPQNNE